jgi:hypothetical protein
MILKKILGYLFYLLGIIFSMSVLGNIMSLMSGRRSETTIEKFENLFALVIAGVLAYVLFKYAKKWTTKKSKDEIEEIGEE